MQFSKIHLLAVSGALLALSLLAPAFGAEETKAKPTDAEIEARLEAARTRLEAAAREVAELSAQLTGPMIEDFMIAGFGDRAMLGVNIGGERGKSKDGVHIESVSPGGPASAAGLKAGDVLVSVDGKSLRGEEEPGRTLVRHMRGVKPGDKVQVEYQRNGKTQRVDVVTKAMDHKRFLVGGGPDRMMHLPNIAAATMAYPFAKAFAGFGAHGLLDMELITLTPKLGHYFGTDKGVLVVRPPSNSELKLEEGDVIVDIDGRQPQNGSHALRILRSYQPGEKINVNVLRNRKPTKLQLTMPEAPEFGPAGALLMTDPFEAPGPGATPLPELPPPPSAAGST